MTLLQVLRRKRRVIPAPTLEASSYLGLLRIKCGVRPGAAFVGVHVGESADFSPSPATLIDNLVRSGVVFASVPQDSDRFIKAVEGDWAGREVARSETVRVQVNPLYAGYR